MGYRKRYTGGVANREHLPKNFWCSLFATLLSIRHRQEYGNISPLLPILDAIDHSLCVFLSILGLFFIQHVVALVLVVLYMDRGSITLVDDLEYERAKVLSI